MNQNFIDYVKSHIKEYLPTEYQNAVISINEVTKSNDRMLTGLTILLPGEQAAPTIYLEALAEQVERGMPLDTAMKQIAQIQLENYSRVPLNISMLENYEAVRPMLAVQMCDPETNQEYLKGKPYTSCGELAAYYRIQVAADEEGTASVAVTESMMQMWGITKEQLHKDAMQAAHARSPVCLYDMEEVMAESIFSVKPENLFNREEPLDIGFVPIYILTKGQKYHDVSRTNGVWSNSTILRLLADERYIGTYVIGKKTVTEIGGNRMRTKDESEWIKIPNHHTPLVSKELFEKANASIKRFKIPKRKQHSYPLRGKVFCGSCKHAMHRSNETIYRCRFSYMDSSQPCYGMTIRESELESIVYEFLCKQFEVSLGIDGPNELKPVDKVAVRRAEFDNQIFELQEEKRKLYEALVIKQIDVNLYKEQKALIEQRLLEVQNTKAVVMTRLEAEQQEKERQHQQKDVLQSLVENKGLTSELVDMLIEKIFIYPNKRVEIVLKIKNDLA